MIEKKNIKPILAGLIILIVVSAGIFIGLKNRNQPCNGISVQYKPNATDTLIGINEITEIAQRTADSIIGCAMSNLPKKEIIKALVASPFIEKAQINYGLHGTLNIRVTQTKVIIRIINMASEYYYIDYKGNLIPTGMSPVRLPVVTGYISPKIAPSGNVFEEGKELLHDLYQIGMEISGNSFMNALTEQIYVNRDKKIELVAKAGIKNIVLGDATNLKVKFENLELFYEQKLPFIDRNKYKKLDISFDNQIIAQK